MMNLHFIRRGLSPHASNSQQQKQTPNSNNNSIASSTSSLSTCRKRTLESIDLDDLPSPPSLFSSSSIMNMMNANNSTISEHSATTFNQQQEQQQSIEDEVILSSNRELYNSNYPSDLEEEQEEMISQTPPILKTQFPPSSIVEQQENKFKKNDSIGDCGNDDEEDQDNDDDLREFSIKQIGFIKKKRKLNLVNSESEKSENLILVEEDKQVLLTQFPASDIKQNSLNNKQLVLTPFSASDTKQHIDEDDFLNDAIAPQGHEIIKSLEDNIIEEFTFTPDDDFTQIPKQMENTPSRQVDEDIDIHVDLHELDYDLSTNVETSAQKPEENQPRKILIDFSTQTDNSLLPKVEPVVHKIVNNDPNNICSICLSSWSSTGLHQVCCLSCGHLFGKNCIEKWLKKNSTCPKCKKPADRGHIRLLYVDNIHAVDTQKIEELENRLEAETNAKKELEIIRNGLELRIKMLTEQKGNTQHVYDNHSTPTLESDTNKRKSLIQRSLELAERKKREFDLMNPEEDSTRTIVCNNGKSKSVQHSRKNSSYLYGTSGGNKLLFNTPLENSGLIEISNNQVFINFERRDKTCGFYVLGLEKFMNNPSLIQQTRKVIHNSPISDIKPHYLLSTGNSKGYNIDYSRANLILTSSLDKSMRITDLRQGTANSVCFCPSLAKGLVTSIACCEWNRSNQNYCFAGLSSGSILCYDIRNPAEPFLTTGDNSSSPHTMFHVPNKGLVVGSDSSLVCYDENQSGYTKGRTLFSKEISSLNFNTSNNTLLFTSRESSKSSQVQLFTFEGNLQVSCLENISINHKGTKLGRPYISDNGQNYLSTMAIPKPEDFSVEIWKSQTDQDYSYKNDIKLQSSTEIIQSCALSFNNLFVVTKENLSAYII